VGVVPMMNGDFMPPRLMIGSSLRSEMSLLAQMRPAMMAPLELLLVLSRRNC
jgi:hypothetical protein